jgi:tetratricopeptide (TPR) repeat protein
MRVFILRLFALLILSFYCYIGNQVLAQDPPNDLALARQFSLAKEYEKSISIYEKLYQKSPFDKSLYNEYFTEILNIKNYTKAVEVAKYMQTIRRNDLTILADMAYAYELAGDKKQATTIWGEVLEQAIRDQYQLELVVESLKKREKYDKAISIYEQARKLYNQNELFAKELSTLYLLNGDKNKALHAILDLTSSQQGISPEELKNSLSLLISNDSKLEKELGKELSKRLEKQPSHILMEVWIWYRLQSNTWKELPVVVEEMDRKHQANGLLALQLGIMLYQNDQIVPAYDALQLAQKLNTNQQYLKDIIVHKNLILKKQILSVKPIDKSKSQMLAQNFLQLFDKYPSYLQTDVYLDYVEVVATFLDSLNKGIELLDDFVKTPQVRKDTKSKAKLQLGDYLMMKGEPWESTLLYAQVGKDHKEDALGEWARYKNAQLSYFMGEFEWAQQQLKVLKAASSDMIANDALYLSILITENTPMDSNWGPLQAFASADLYFHQHKIIEATQILDSLSANFPEHPLQDDILMMQSKIAHELGNYDVAIAKLEQIYTLYKDDVLADDALWRLATIYETIKKDKANAKLYYEKIITEFPTSTYIQAARQKYKQLENALMN